MGEQDLSRMASRIALEARIPEASFRSQASPWDVTSALDECKGFVSDIWASVQIGHARPDAGEAAQEALNASCAAAASELFKAKSLIEKIWASTRPKKRRW